ncbi:MAG: HupE/UreJ family protein [Alphaproteobacteria bacterium]|mgnify:CR=1 FL=1|nr:HupE/UreJ family protein [Alphaproteobacteria bacterium]
MLIAFAISIALCLPASAHTRSQSFSTWTVADSIIDGVFQIDAYRVTQLSETPQDLTTLLRDHLASTVKLTQDGTTCAAAAPRVISAPRGDLRVELRFTCAKPFAENPAQLHINAFFDVSISHVHYIRITDADGFHEAVLTQGRSDVAVGGATAHTGTDVASFLLLGFEHVLSGIDHIAFLLALAMLAGGLWRILLAVTGFTLGHSLTLALVALGILRPDTAAVEALIGFTVAWAAGDALARARNMSPWYGLAGAAGILALPLIAWITGLPVLSWLLLAGLALFAGTMSFARRFDGPYVAPAIATVFGLAHGAGFAGPLLEMDIPPGQLIWTLLAFNLGVEGGQLAALAIMGAVLWILRSTLTQVPKPAFDATAAALFALGTFWFVSRAFA